MPFLAALDSVDHVMPDGAGKEFQRTFVDRPEPRRNDGDEHRQDHARRDRELLGRPSDVAANRSAGSADRPQGDDCSKINSERDRPFRQPRQACCDTEDQHGRSVDAATPHSIQADLRRRDQQQQHAVGQAHLGADDGHHAAGKNECRPQPAATPDGAGNGDRQERDSSRHTQCRRQPCRKAAAGAVFTENAHRRRLAPIDEDRLCSAESVQEMGDDPIAALQHLP
ncbi:MAG: hypothetical protein QM754_20550 [Tepidisphaeraceae bacterium]